MNLQSIIITVLLYLIIILGWIILISIGNSFKGKGNEGKGKIFNGLGLIWFIFAILFIIYKYITLLLIYPSILPPTLVIIFIIIISFITFRFIFPSQHFESSLKELSRYKNFTIFVVIMAPIVIAILLYWSKTSITVGTALVLYSSIFLAFISLLVLVAMFSIFIIERHIHNRVVNLLIQTVKGVSLMYGLTIFMSLLAKKIF